MTVWRLLGLAWLLVAAGVLLLVATSMAWDGLTWARARLAARRLDHDLAEIDVWGGDQWPGVA